MPSVSGRVRILGALGLCAALLLGFPARLDACRDAIVPAGDWKTTDGKLVSATEGGIIQVGATWYLWGLDRSKNNHSFEGVNLYSSPDLVHWTFVRQILKKTSDPLLDNGAVIERAKILQNQSTGKFVMWMHYEGHDAYSVAEVAYAVADEIDGDYVLKEHFRPLTLDSRDLNVYQDTDGSAYLLCTTKGNQNVSLFALDASYTKVTKELFRGNASDDFECEGHSIVKSGGYYFWLMSWCSGWDFNDNHYYYSKSLAGPWTAGGNIAPAGAKTYESQVGWAFPMPGDDGTNFVYMGDRWSVNNFSASRMVMLPLQVKGTKVTLPWHDRWYPARDSGWTAGGAQLPDGVYQIRVRQTGKVLQPVTVSTSASPRVQQVAATGAESQNWRIENMGGSNFRVTSVSNGLRLDVNGGSREVGAALLTYADNGAANQRWHVVATEDGFWRFVNVNTLGKAIQIDGASTANGAAAVLGDFAYAKNQEFELVPVNGIIEGGTYVLTARHSGKVAKVVDGEVVQMAESGSASEAFVVTSRGQGRYSLRQGPNVLKVTDDSIADSAPLSMTPDSGLAGQWTINDVGGGWYSIANVCSGKVLDVVGGESATADGVKIKQWTDSKAANQQWKLKKVDPRAARIATRSDLGPGIRLVQRGGELTVTSQTRIDRIEILDHNGAKRFQWEEPFVGKRTLRVQGLEPGAYLVRTRSLGSQWSRTMVVL